MDRPGRNWTFDNEIYLVLDMFKTKKFSFDFSDEMTSALNAIKQYNEQRLLENDEFLYLFSEKEIEQRIRNTYDFVDMFSKEELNSIIQTNSNILLSRHNICSYIIYVTEDIHYMSKMTKMLNDMKYDFKYYSILKNMRRKLFKVVFDCIYQKIWESIDIYMFSKSILFESTGCPSIELLKNTTSIF